MVISMFSSRFSPVSIDVAFRELSDDFYVLVAFHNVFLKFCLLNKTNEAIILSSLLVRAETVGELVRKATTVAWLIDKNKAKPVTSFFVKPNSYNQIH